MLKAKQKSQHDFVWDPHDCRVRVSLWPGLALCILPLLFGAESAGAQETDRAYLSDTHSVQDNGTQRPGAGLASRMDHRVANSLWQGRIQVVPETEKQARDRAELQKLIDRLNAFHIRQRQAGMSGTATGTTQSSTDLATPGLPAPTELHETSPTPVAQPKTATPAVSKLTKDRAGALSSDILKKLTKRPGLADEVVDPFSIAEILYLSGQLPEAARFYESALKRVSPDDPASSQKRAWIVLQRANCLRQQDPIQAIEMYQMLLREHPDSPWQESAQTWLKLAQWFSQERPVELIEECEQLKVSTNQALKELDS